MIRFDGVTFRYDDGPNVIENLTLVIDEGELVVVVGPTGSGKTTLLKMIDGLVPHFSGGELAGDIVVEGRSIRTTPPTELAGLVGYVGQDPTATFVTDRVEDEIAYAMENLGVEPIAMRRRVEDALDLMSLHDLRDRPLRTLSGGQRQRVAIAAVLASSPRILVLDEPTSALDPGAAEEVLGSLTRLVHDVGMTVVVAEHRLERVLPFADRVVALDDMAGITVGPPGEMMAESALAPPLVELGRLAGWSPIPVTVRAARRMAGELVDRLSAKSPQSSELGNGDLIARVSGASVAYGQVQALDRVSLEINAGTITALMGRNGSGKSTLLAGLAGMRSADEGSFMVAGRDPSAMGSSERIAAVGLVPQDPGNLLYAQSVGAECSTADAEHGLGIGTTRATLDRIINNLDDSQHPRDLSEGQRLSLALGVVMAAKPRLLLLDEPTRGLDYDAKRSLVTILQSLKAEGVAVVLATHDVELVAMVADRAIVLAQGELIADGPARDVVCHTPAFAPQVAKVLSPQFWLTVSEVEEALCAPAPR
jgi:energy-coupling factor transport system ATP-binding protein